MTAIEKLRQGWQLRTFEGDSRTLKKKKRKTLIKKIKIKTSKTLTKWKREGGRQPNGTEDNFGGRGWGKWWGQRERERGGGGAG